MDSEVFVSKTTFINLLGASAVSTAVFLTSDDPQAKAIKFLFENVDMLDINCFMVKGYILPMLTANGALSADDMTRIDDYIAKALS